MKCNACDKNIPVGVVVCPLCGEAVTDEKPSSTSRLRRFEDPSEGAAPAPAPSSKTSGRARFETIAGGSSPPETSDTPDEMPESLGIYKVEGVIGQGGMGAVYLGVDEQLNRKVALKVLPPQVASTEEFIRRFLDEARAVAKFTHPNVVAIYFAGSDGGRHFFAMEYVEGDDLRHLVESVGPLGPRRAMGYAIQAVKGLQAAFGAGIVHRDVKPGNLMLAADDTVKVADFGLAKPQTGGGVEETAVGQVVGSPYYMSPEQGQGHRVDHRSDIYSLGATLFFLLTGRPPYLGDDAISVIFKHVSEPVPKLPRAPFGLERLMERMMAKDPDERPADYDQLLRDMEKLHQKGLPANPLVDGDWDPTKESDTTATTIRQASGAADRERQQRLKALLARIDAIVKR